MRKTIRANGSIGIAAYCLTCGRRATRETWLPNRRFSEAEIAAMPIEADYRGGEKCQYAGCEERAVEWNHYAPRYLFGDDCERWYIGPLCPAHHKTWHAGLKGELMRKCPKCGHEMNAAAIVEVFPAPAGWAFYGPAGSRFMRCRGNVDGRGYVHFVVNDNGRQYHRLAYGIERMAEPEPVQESLQ